MDSHTIYDTSPAWSPSPSSTSPFQYISRTFILSGFFWVGVFLLMKYIKDRMHTPRHDTPHPHRPRSPPRPQLNPLFVRAAESFPTFQYPMPRRNTECPVCTNPFEEGGQVTLLLPCMHYMHRECLAGMLAAHRRCALCRTEMDLEDGLPRVEPLA